MLWEHGEVPDGSPSTYATNPDVTGNLSEPINVHSHVVRRDRIMKGSTYRTTEFVDSAPWLDVSALAKTATYN
jgi:hypothetical protein